VFVLGRWMLSGKNRPRPAILLRLTAAPLLLIVAAGSWLAYYDYRVFGNPLTLPYKINRATYAVVPYYVWQRPLPMPAYRHKVMRDYYVGVEIPHLTELKTPFGFVTHSLLKLGAILFFAGVALLPPLIMVRRVFLDRRVRFLVMSLCVVAAGMSIQIFLLPHYLAPFTAAFYAIGLQAMRHLRVWNPGDKPVGAVMVRLIVLICVVMGVLRAWAEPLNLKLADWPAEAWYGSGDLGTPRARIETELEHLPGKQLAIVRYSPMHESRVEWVYNAADIDNSRVIWAREMDAADNQELLRRYKDRKVWLVQPDTDPVQVNPYSPSGQEGVAQR
jgi:hypothetical protein